MLQLHQRSSILFLFCKRTLNLSCIVQAAFGVPCVIRGFERTRRTFQLGLTQLKSCFASGGMVGNFFLLLWKTSVFRKTSVFQISLTQRKSCFSFPNLIPWPVNKNASRKNYRSPRTDNRFRYPWDTTRAEYVISISWVFYFQKMIYSRDTLLKKSIWDPKIL